MWRHTSDEEWNILVSCLYLYYKCKHNLIIDDYIYSIMNLMITFTSDMSGGVKLRFIIYKIQQNPEYSCELCLLKW